MRGFLCAAVAAGLLSAAAPAQAYITINAFRVEPVSPMQFQVIPRGGMTDVDAWCAAGDYVMRMLTLPPKTPIWRISEPPRKRLQTVVFSLSAEGAASTSGLNQLNATTLYLTAAAARGFCPASLDYWDMSGIFGRGLF